MLKDIQNEYEELSGENQMEQMTEDQENPIVEQMMENQEDQVEQVKEDQEDQVEQAREAQESPVEQVKENQESPKVERRKRGKKTETTITDESTKESAAVKSRGERKVNTSNKTETLVLNKKDVEVPVNEPPRRLVSVKPQREKKMTIGQFLIKNPQSKSVDGLMRGLYSSEIKTESEWNDLIIKTLKRTVT